MHIYNIDSCIRLGLYLAICSLGFRFCRAVERALQQSNKSSSRSLTLELVGGQRFRALGIRPHSAVNMGHGILTEK